MTVAAAARRCVNKTFGVVSYSISSFDLTVCQGDTTEQQSSRTSDAPFPSRSAPTTAWASGKTPRQPHRSEPRVFWVREQHAGEGARSRRRPRQTLCSADEQKGVMKCSRCYDYNKGVRRGVCRACSYNRFDLSELEEALSSAELEDTALALSFEEAVERNRWSEEEARAVGTNTHAVHLCVKAVFKAKAMVHREGSVRKNTATNASDVDLMVTLSSRKKMSDAERDDLLRALTRSLSFAR